MPKFRSLSLFLALTAGMIGVSSEAQSPPVLPSVKVPNRTTSLQDQLNARLKATTDERKNFIRFVVEQVNLKKLDIKLVVAVERYAIRRNPQFPFPFFERAMRIEAAKRGVTLPESRQFATTKSPTG
jgi:hypothetical protein